MSTGQEGNQALSYNQRCVCWPGAATQAVQPQPHKETTLTSSWRTGNTVSRGRNKSIIPPIGSHLLLGVGFPTVSDFSPYSQLLSNGDFGSTQSFSSSFPLLLPPPSHTASLWHSLLIPSTITHFCMQPQHSAPSSPLPFHSLLSTHKRSSRAINLQNPSVFHWPFPVEVNQVSTQMENPQPSGRDANQSGNEHTSHLSIPKLTKGSNL